MYEHPATMENVAKCQQNDRLKEAEQARLVRNSQVNSTNMLKQTLFLIVALLVGRHPG